MHRVIGAQHSTILCAPYQLQILGFELAIALKVVAHINAFHVQRAVVNMVGQRLVQQGFDFKVFHHTALHGREVFFFVHAVPIDHLLDGIF
jgi:hypothetical protein